jgi:hypothetical protein
MSYGDRRQIISRAKTERSRVEVQLGLEGVLDVLGLAEPVALPS